MAWAYVSFSVFLFTELIRSIKQRKFQHKIRVLWSPKKNNFKPVKRSTADSIKMESWQMVATDSNIVTTSSTSAKWSRLYVVEDSPFSSPPSLSAIFSNLPSLHSWSHLRENNSNLPQSMRSLSGIFQNFVQSKIIACNFTII